MPLPPLINKNSQTPQERIKTATTSLVDRYACKECGSTFFEPHTAIQCTVSNYAIRGTSVTPQTFYTCIGCGEQLIPGNLASMAQRGGETEQFLESIETGKSYRSRHNAAKLIKNSASITEVDAIKLEVVRLNEIVINLIEHLSEEEETPEVIIVESSDAIIEVIEETPEKITRRQGHKKV